MSDHWDVDLPMATLNPHNFILQYSLVDWLVYIHIPIKICLSDDRVLPNAVVYHQFSNVSQLLQHLGVNHMFKHKNICWLLTSQKKLAKWLSIRSGLN